MITCLCLIALAWFLRRTLKRIKKGFDKIEKGIEDRKLSIIYLRHDQEKAQKRITHTVQKIQAVRDNVMVGPDAFSLRVQREIQELTK